MQVIFYLTSYTVLEIAIEPVEYCLELYGVLDLEIPVAVNVSFLEGSATSSDFSNTDITYTFSPIFHLTFSGGQCFPLNITEDNVLEDDEVFIISLSSPNQNVDFTNGSVEVTIQDSSVLYLGFENASYVVTEGHNITICVEIFYGSLAEQFTLPLNISPLSGEGK